MNTLVIGGKSGIGRRFIERQPSVWTSDVDVRNYKSLRDTVRMLSPWDEVVYCAGVNSLSGIDSVDQAILQDMFAINVFGFISTLQLLAENQPMHPTSIVAISSDAARNPMRTSIQYCSSKAALNMAVRCAARELAPTFRINAVAPAMIDGTGMTEYIDKAVPEIRGWTPEEALRYERSNIPAGRRGTMDEVCEGIEFLLRGPGFMTGTILDITGGK